VLTSGGNNFNNFRDNQLTKFRFLPTPLNFYEESRFVPSIWWTPSHPWPLPIYETSSN